MKYLSIFFMILGLFVTTHVAAGTENEGTDLDLINTAAHSADGEASDESAIQKFQTRVCKKRGLCRAFEGYGCGLVKTYFSLCYTSCAYFGKHINDFKKSNCVDKAKAKHSLNKDGLYENEKNTVKKEAPPAHLARQVVKAVTSTPKLRYPFVKFCENVVESSWGAKIISKIPENQGRSSLEQSCARLLDKHDEQSGVTEPAKK